MTRRSAILVIALTLGSASLSGKVLAGSADGPLDQIGGACVPDGETIREGLYETRGFGVGFRGASTGTIRLLCPFPVNSNMLGANVGLTFLSFIDGDGIGEGARVQAIFRHAAIGSNVAITNGVCDSNTSTATGPTNIGCFNPSLTLKIDETYWWDIEIQRSDPSINVEFLSVGMRYYN